jgi:leader peptidase (prepilin peptidase)/N-methyltransferase
LTVTVPTAGPARTPGWWHGAAADRRRLLIACVLSVVLLGAMGGGMGWRPWLPAYLWLAATAVALAVIDIDCHRLPDAFTLPAYGAGVVLLGIAALAAGDGHSYLRALSCMAVVFAAFYLLAFLGGIGFGDTKLAGALGLYLGWLGVGPLVLGLVAGFCIGAVVALVLLAARSVGWKTDVAFGPALLAGAVFAVLSGQQIVDAYVGTVT